jgi:glycosyltransferase involved in cell wall biosynthesis
LALAASALARHYGARFIANIHDIFPQNGMDLVARWQKLLAWLAFSWMERLVYSRANFIVVPSENHAKYLKERRDVPQAKLTVVPHWIDTASYDAASSTGRFRKAWGIEKNFIFFFGGVLGPSQGLEMVLDAAEAFRANPDAKFLFVGDGGVRSKLERLVDEKKLTNVIFRPFVSSSEYPFLVKEMDVGFLTLTSRNTTPAVPAKLMGYMAAGIPVVLAVHRESDAIRIVNEAKCGFTAVSDDSRAVVAAFRAAYDARRTLRSLGENGRNYLKEHFTKEKLMGEWEVLFSAPHSR